MRWLLLSFLFAVNACGSDEPSPQTETCARKDDAGVVHTQLCDRATSCCVGAAGGAVCAPRSAVGSLCP